MNEPLFSPFFLLQFFFSSLNSSRLRPGIARLSPQAPVIEPERPTGPPHLSVISSPLSSLLSARYLRSAENSILRFGSTRANISPLFSPHSQLLRQSHSRGLGNISLPSFPHSPPLNFFLPSSSSLLIPIQTAAFRRRFLDQAQAPSVVQVRSPFAL